MWDAWILATIRADMPRPRELPPTAEEPTAATNVTWLLVTLPAIRRATAGFTGRPDQTHDDREYAPTSWIE